MPSFSVPRLTPVALAQGAVFSASAHAPAPL